MAETVKKSRIVSDNEDDLEEALMEEFNMRLKSCMSQDDLQNPEDEEEEDEEEEEQQQQPSAYVEIVKSPIERNGAASKEFIRNEQENCYDEPKPLLKNGHRGEEEHQKNGHREEAEPENQEVIYENVAPLTLKTDTPAQPSDQQHYYVDMTVKSPPPLSPENYEIMLPEALRREFTHEDLEETEGKPSDFRIPTTLLISSAASDGSLDLGDGARDAKSVKDRMLLSTDATPCLLFSQTVTSPMLTPSEENIDFLKGFRRESSTQNSTDSGSNGAPPVTDLDEEVPGEDAAPRENVYENSEFLRHKGDDAIYENLKEAPAENIYENLKDLEEVGGFAGRGDAIYQNVEDLKKETADFLCREVEDTLSAAEQEKEGAVEDQRSEDLVSEEMASENGGDELAPAILENGGNAEKDTETVPPRIVENLKSQFSSTVATSTVSNVKKEIEDVGDLKSVDIMKQINKFEKSDENEDSSTQVTQSYVETTTFESNSSELDRGSLKKKKSKKSRKEEKENISVNGTANTNSQESYYNVNVKSLCRSFGDLTKIEDEKLSNKRRAKSYTDSRARAKSLSDVTSAPPNKIIENVFSGVSVRALKSSFNKFDALQKKNVLHVRSSDSSKAQEKFNGAQVDTSNCKACDKAVFQMEQIKAEKAIWHKNCFRCKECNKQLTVDIYQSHEGTLYCKPHFRALFAPKVVDDDPSPKSRRPELIIRENQPAELPPDVVRASDKPDLGLEELQSLNVKERFQVFEHYQSETGGDVERNDGPVNVKRSPSILSKLARFQAKGMDIGVADDSLNGIPIEESSSEEEVQEEEGDGEDADLVRAKKVQKEKPFHFTGMSDVKSKWEHGEQNSSRDERREERKQEIQSIRSKLFMGKQVKMKEAYQQAVMESESCTNLLRKEPIEVCDTKSLKERFEKGEPVNEPQRKEKDEEDVEVFESEISKKSRSLFLELDANASKAPQITTPLSTPKLDVKKAREAYLARTSSDDVIKSSVDQVEDVQVRTADIKQRFNFFETYKEPDKAKKQFRITPPRDGQVKEPTPDREVYRDPDVVRSEEIVEDSVVAKESHTATKMLNKFRQMEENMTKESVPAGPKPLKRFTPPPEPTRPESRSTSNSGSEEESDEEDETDRARIPDVDLLEAKKAARAQQLRAKFERWEANELEKEQNNSAVNLAEELGEDQSQIESTRTLRARFESMRETSSESNRAPRVKVNRFVEIPNVTETCESCNSRVYPLEKISVHGHVYHKQCFKCMECSCILRMDSYSYNQGLLYCMPHFKRLFISKGNYDTGFGLGQHKEKWTNGNAQVA